ncbi:MAG: DNA recombination protein RmuC [Elusimicrobia bacterium]|nr:DNA recombination protein RmuC [Elusimicrobiota bacterium]
MENFFIFFFGVITGVLALGFKYVKALKDNAAKTQKIQDLLEASQTQNGLKLEFENIASKIMEDKSSKLTELNKTALESVISPFKEKMEDFKNKVNEAHLAGISQTATLSSELKRLMELNRQVSVEANNLAQALKGESKTQGNWGEMTLEKIFEASGMIKGVHYSAQTRFEDLDNIKIPDYIINLPEGKHVVVDAKVSLTAYEKYFNDENETSRAQFLSEHTASIKKHISDLNKKDYSALAQIIQPEYVLMFVPVEGALTQALKAAPDIYDFAFSKNIVIVTPSTLLAVLKTVAYIWRQENQKRNVLEIARQGGALYDKFAAFAEVLIKTRDKINEAGDKCSEAIKRLSSSDKKGDSLIERAAKLKELGASVKKDIPESLAVADTVEN